MLADTGVRPVPLEIAIQSFDIANLEARMQAMARPAYTAVSAAAAAGKPSILFVPTRKQARLTALDLLTYAAADGAPKKFLQVGACPCLCWELGMCHCCFLLGSTGLHCCQLYQLFRVAALM